MSLAAAVAILAALFSQGVLAQAKDPAFIKDYKPAMPGVLLRGGSRGANPLNEHQLQRLCQDGVGHAIYTYDTGFKQGTARTCIRKDGTQGRIEYSYYRFLDKKGIEDLDASDPQLDRESQLGVGVCSLLERLACERRNRGHGTEAIL